jgi:hypothetical protein
MNNDVCPSTPPACRRSSVEADRLQHLAPFVHPHAPLAADICVPDGAFRIETYTVGKY